MRGVAFEKSLYEKDFHSWWFWFIFWAARKRKSDSSLSTKRKAACKRSSTPSILAFQEFRSPYSSLKLCRRPRNTFVPKCRCSRVSPNVEDSEQFLFCFWSSYQIILSSCTGPGLYGLRRTTRCKQSWNSYNSLFRMSLKRLRIDVFSHCHLTPKYRPEIIMVLWSHKWSSNNSTLPNRLQEPEKQVTGPNYTPHWQNCFHIFVKSSWCKSLVYFFHQKVLKLCSSNAPKIGQNRSNKECAKYYSSIIKVFFFQNS